MNMLIALGILALLVHADCFSMGYDDSNEFKRDMRKSEDTEEGLAVANLPRVRTRPRHRPQPSIDGQETTAKSIDIVKTITDLLQSKTVKQYTDKFAKKAAVVYRTLRDEFLPSRRNEDDKTDE